MQNHPSHISLSPALGCLVLLIFVAFPVTSAAQTLDYAEWENGVTERWRIDLSAFTRQEIDTAIERWEAIEEENQRTKSHRWAGSYFIGTDTHGTYMRWSPGAGFIMAHVNKCAAQLTGLSYGRVVASSAAVQFIFAHRKILSSHGHGHAPPATPTTVGFIPVVWRNQHYLVKESELADFGSYVAGLGEFNREYVFLDDGALFFSRTTDRAEGAIEESPKVPLGYGKFLRRPIDATITSVGIPAIKPIHNGSGSFRYEEHIPVTVNAGSATGIRRGMFFHILSAEVYEAVKIIRVGARSSRGVVIRVLGESPEEGRDNLAIRTGWRLSTSAHKYFFYNSPR
jgi:hypothetical protein